MNADTGEAVMILYDSNQIQVLFQPGTSPYLLVTFATKNEIANGAHFWGKSLASKAGLTVIGIMPKSPNWYPAAEMQQIVCTVSERLASYKKIVLYGQSMGGYGALKYSAAFGATHILSFSPQFSINPDDLCGKDQRFISSFKPALHKNMSVTSQDIRGEAYVFYDPFCVEDNFNVRRIAQAAPDLCEVRVPMTSHFPITLFRSTERVMRLIEACISGDREAVVTMSRQARRASPIRVSTVCELYARRNIWAARRMYERRSVQFPQADIAGFYSRIGALALESGDVDAAEGAFSYALILDPYNPHFLHRMSNVCARRQDFGAAAEWARRAVAAKPADAALHNHLGGMLLAKDDLGEAEKAFQAALRLEPSNTNVFRRLSNLWARRQHPTEALMWAERAVSTAPNDAAAHCNLSGILLRFGNIDGAERAARKAFDLAPDNADALRRLKNVELRRRAHLPAVARDGRVAASVSSE